MVGTGIMMQKNITTKLIPNETTNIYLRTIKVYAY